jgi:hypothetical protein
LGTAGLLSACLPHEADFRVGVSTSEVVGYVEADSGSLDPRDILIVVFLHHYLFETLETEQRVYRVSADIRGVERDGTFRVPMPSDVVSLELIVVAPDRLSTEFRFNRQVGIGQVSYHPMLQAHAKWYSHYYTYVQPMLSNLIVERRYQLSNDDQQRIGDWLTLQSARMDALREAQAAARMVRGEEEPATEEPQ